MSEDDRTDIDADLIRTLAGLLDETGLTEIEYGVRDIKVRVARQVAPMAAAPLMMPAAAAPAAPAAPGSVEETIDHPGTVRSPMVGVVYTSPEPGADPYVRVGDQVNEGQTLVLIEAMKVFNPIAAPRAGRVTRVLVANGSPVEFNEPLMIIE